MRSKFSAVVTMWIMLFRKVMPLYSDKYLLISENGSTSKSSEHCEHGGRKFNLNVGKYPPNYVVLCPRRY
jgi:hypothetical protein